MDETLALARPAGRANARFAPVAPLFVAAVVLLTGQSKPATSPAESEDFAAALRRLHRIKPKDISDEQIAMRAALEFAIAIGAADGDRAAKVLDATGYQPLPLTGDLPESPDKPIPDAALKTRMQSWPRADWTTLPIESACVVTHLSLRTSFPAAARWMLPNDVAILLQPATSRTDFVAKECCLIVRVRAGRAAVVGGNLLAVTREK